MLVCHEMVSSVVHFFWLECQHTAGTSHDTEVATFATFSVDVYSSYDLRGVFKIKIRFFREARGGSGDPNFIYLFNTNLHIIILMCMVLIKL